MEEIIAILVGCFINSAPGDDKILFRFLKALGIPIAIVLILLINISLKLEHFPPFLKRARTIVLKKLGKDSYKIASL